MERVCSLSRTAFFSPTAGTVLEDVTKTDTLCRKEKQILSIYLNLHFIFCQLMPSYKSIYEHDEVQEELLHCPRRRR